MKLSKSLLVNLISYFFVALFCYAASIKIMDFESFRNQITNSAYLRLFPDLLPYIIIVLEFLVAGLLCYQKTRTIGLCGSLILMCIFTAYIALMLWRTENLPCSCGGILESMSWKQHLFFNILCVVLSTTALRQNLKLHLAR